jgi:hypothetical protein
VTAKAVRRLVIGVCVAGIGGMIAGSVADNNGIAITAGSVTAIAVLCLMVATAVTGGATVGSGERVEELAEDLVADGADEAAVRELIREAVKLGRSQCPSHEG